MRPFAPPFPWPRSRAGRLVLAGLAIGARLALGVVSSLVLLLALAVAATAALGAPR